MNNSTYFNIDKNNNLIGYHCEGGETFEDVNNIPLSMDTLNNDRILFLCNNTTEWYPNHLNNLDNFKMYSIIFKQPLKYKTYNSLKKYLDLFDYNDELKNYFPTNETQKLINKGCHLFILGKNIENELTEAFLVYPKNYVLSIMEIKS